MAESERQRAMLLLEWLEPASNFGGGMSAEVMSRAFEPFFTTKPLGQGAGLDLTGYARNAALAQGFLESRMSLLTKPFTVDALLQHVAALLEST